MAIGAKQTSEIVDFFIVGLVCVYVAVVEKWGGSGFGSHPG